MKKRLLLVILTVIAIMASALFVGCGGNKDSETSAETPSASQSETHAEESEETKEVTIVLDKKDLVVDMYDEEELFAAVKNSDDDVIWTSDDPSIATVENGVVKGVAEGETIIRASVAGKTAVCNVVVSKSSELPVLRTEYSEMNLYSGDIYDFEVYAKWKNKKVSASYEWAVKEGGDVVTVEEGEENGIFTLTALKAGVAEYTVSATAVGSTVYADVKFVVTVPDFALEIANFEKTDDGFTYTLWRKAGEETSVNAETIVKRAGKEIDYAEIDWSSSNEEVAVADNGVITGKTDGKAVITATVTGRGIEPFETKIDLTVKEEIYRKVTYYDSDKKTVLNEESVLDGTAAGYVNTVYPAEEDLGDGYKAFYNRCDWVTENGRDASESLKAVTSDISVYAAYGYIAYKHYEFTSAASDNTVFNGPFANQNKYAKIENGKLAMSFRAYADNTQVALMELVNWSTPLTMNCQKDVWYTFVVEFIADETGEHEYVGVKAYILDENGNVIQQAAASDYDERTWAFAKLPLISDGKYASECQIDVGVPMTGIKNSYTVKYYDENGAEINVEDVSEGGKATYAYSPETAEQDRDLGNGYTLSYYGYKWVSELNGKTEVSLDEITEDKVVYLKKIYIAYTKAEKYDATGGYKSVMSFNKYVLADVNGNVEFKLRLNGTSGASFILYEKSTWTSSETVQWVDGNDWWTVTGEASTKTVTVYNPNGDVAVSKVFNEYNAETLSIVFGSNVDIAAVDPKIKTLFDVTYYDLDGTTVLYTEKVEEGDKAVYEAPTKDLGDGYSEIYFNAKWLKAHGGSEIADLTNITENMSVYLSGEKYITKSYEYARQDANGGGLMNKPASVHKYAEIKDGKMEFYVMPHEAYSKFGLMELVNWSAPMQVYLPTADVWYKFVINFGDEITCSAYNADGTVLDGKENVALTGFTQDNFWMIVYTQITDWSTPAFADNGSCEIAFKA